MPGLNLEALEDQLNEEKAKNVDLAKEVFNLTTSTRALVEAQAKINDHLLSAIRMVKDITSVNSEAIKNVIDQNLKMVETLQGLVDLNVFKKSKNTNTPEKP